MKCALQSRVTQVEHETASCRSTFGSVVHEVHPEAELPLLFYKASFRNGVDGVWRHTAEEKRFVRHGIGDGGPAEGDQLHDKRYGKQAYGRENRLGVAETAAVASR